METMICGAMGSEPATWFVCLMGIAVVFVGLILLIGIVYLMNGITGKRGEQAQPVASPAPAAPTAALPVIENRQEIIAAVCAAIAEENGTDISAIRVLSFKKIEA